MSIAKYLFLSIRPKQWIKNLFIILPLIFGRKLFFYPDNGRAFLALLLFSLTSSAVYLLNDIIDIEKDKFHPVKSSRPLASGKISVRDAAIVSALLGIVSTFFSFVLDIGLGWTVIAYLGVNLFYSLFLKNIVIIDIFCVGCFFLLRILAGGFAAHVLISHWIIIMTFFLALFLGFVKRRQELIMLEENSAYHRTVLSKYNSYFIDQLITVIVSSIVVSHMLYTVDARTVKEFGSRHLLYSVPFVYYGIFRYLYLIHKAKTDGDPTNILLSDRPLQAAVIFWVIVCIAVVYFGL